MIDTVQAVLLFVIVLLTILLIVLGIQVFFILKEFRNTITRTNKILDNTETITEGISEPVNLIRSIFSNTSAIGSIAKLIKLLAGKEERHEHH